MLTALGLGNFKAFSDTQRLPIRPITLIFGANSAGKSSLIHGLLLARHADETGKLDVHRTALGGESVDLGGFRQYVHRRQFGRAVEWSAEIDVGKLEGRVAELLAPLQSARISLAIALPLGDNGEPMQGAEPRVGSYEIEGDGESLLRMSARPDGSLRLDRLSHEHPVLRKVLEAIIETATTTEELSPGDYDNLSKVIAEIVPEISATSGGFLPSGMRKVTSPRATEQGGFFVSRGRREDDLAAAVRFFLPRQLAEIIDGLSEAIGQELGRLTYLGPLRSYPPRHLAFAQYHDPNWLAGGGYAWDVCRRDTHVRNAVNKWLSSADRLQTPYELLVRDLVSLEELEDPLIAGLESISEHGLDWEADFDDEGVPESGYPVVKDPGAEAAKLMELIRASDLQSLPELVLMDRRTNTIVSHRDVGIGISQVLPVLAGSYGHKGAIVAIEQPEIHLHPKLQAELGDVFIESALGERANTFIIETHSEHLILRMLKRIRQTTAGKNDQTAAIRPEHMSLLFVGGGPAGSTVQEMRVDDKGRIIDRIPGGFFEEAFEELF